MSDSYKALTRKYRPRSFDDVVSQEHVINTLRNAIQSQRISHAYLFCGPRGVGKTTMARVVARMINGVSMDIDGEELGRTLDIIEIDAASNSGVDDVRHLRDGVRVPPQNGTYKVYIIDEVHMLSKAAFNALLKTLEEPPEYIKFIFATTEPHKVLPTVLSRCQRFDFRRITVSEIVARLRYICEQEHITIDDASLHVIGRKADGALRDALSIMDQAIAFCGSNITHEALLRALNVVSHERLFDIITCAREHDTRRAMAIVDELLMEGHDIQEFLIALTEHLRNMYLAKDAANHRLIEATDDERARLTEAASAFSEEDILRMLHMTSEAQFKVREAQQPRIQLEITMLKLITMERSKGLQELLAEIRDLKKKLYESGTALKSAPESGLAPASAETKPTAASQKSAVPSVKPASAVAKSVAAAPNDAVTPIPTAAETKPTAAAKKSASTEGNSPVISTRAPATNSIFGAPSIRKTSQPAAQSWKPDPVLNPGSDIDEDNFPEVQDPAQAALFGETPFSENTETDPDIDSGTELDTEQSDTIMGVSSEQVDFQLNTVQQAWGLIMDQVRVDCPQLVFFAVNRTRATQVLHNGITLECQDELTAQLIAQHRAQLEGSFTNILGTSIELKTVIRVADPSQQDSNDPYAQFRLLQKQDPKLRLIVDTFGAELEY
jgi:DNA polymerase-3 subunit gamma/tau